jgi:hypothetical protein
MIPFPSFPQKICKMNESQSIAITYAMSITYRLLELGACFVLSPDEGKISPNVVVAGARKSASLAKGVHRFNTSIH